MYRCLACGNPLFDSRTKFHSGTGWPSFTEAMPGSVEMLEDRSYGMARTEVRCARCHSTSATFSTTAPARPAASASA